MSHKLRIVVNGAANLDAVPGLARSADQAEFRFAMTSEQLCQELPGARVLLGWDFASGELREAWKRADDLRWIHWCGAGVDTLLFPELVDSDVVVTNARGVFDRAIAEYVLALILGFAKGIPVTLAAQRERLWRYRVTERIHGRPTLVVGVGSIGREIARTLKSMGLVVTGVGRTARTGDPDFGTVHDQSELDHLLANADFVVNILPNTGETEGMFGARQFQAMKPSARFINVGRGTTVDEGALVEALRKQEIAGAALDVFRTEPLPPDSALWSVPNLVISPHMSGDFHEYEEVLVELFLDNLKRYRAGRPLRNVVNKALGCVTS